jgi:two-component system, OmpR family, response regulator ResD
VAARPAEREPDPKTSVLLAEHEPEVAEMSARYLRRDGLAVRLVTSPEPTLAELTGGPDAAAVIDLTMPGLDPRRIRRALSSTAESSTAESSTAGSSTAGSSTAGRMPVIFLVADARAPRPRGLAARRDASGAAAGARRWLARPFSPRQLVTLVRDVLAGDGHPAEPAGGAPADRSLGGLRLDSASRTATADGRPVPLTATECAVLAALLDNPGRVIPRRQLLAAAGRQSAGDRAADVHITQLRAKLGPAIRIRTVRAAGYALDP